jgi:hypothetical protein
VATPDQSIPNERHVVSEDNLRKLWLEYLAKINDREIQYSQASGITTWALLAVAAAILYRGVPRIPAFLSIAHSTSMAVVILLLEVDILFSLVAGLSGFLAYCDFGTPARLIPERETRFREVLGWMIRPSLIGLALAHFLAAAEGFGPPAFVRVVLIIFGVLWLVGLLVEAIEHSRKNREAKKYGVSLPTFTASRVDANFLRFLPPIFIAIGLFALAALAVLLSRLNAASIHWVTPLGAATQALGFVAVLFALFVRAMKYALRGAFLDLERDIVLETLSPPEIKARYIREALGSSVANCLEELDQKRHSIMSEMDELTDSLRKSTEEIEAMASSASGNRLTEARAAAARYSKGFDAMHDRIRGLLFLLDQTAEARLSASEADLIGHIISDWRTEINQSWQSGKQYLERLAAFEEGAQ